MSANTRFKMKNACKALMGADNEMVEG